MAFGNTANNQNGEKVSQSIWDEKDRRIVRQNCVGNAVRFLKEKPGFDSAEDILKLAEVFEQWVYR